MKNENPPILSRHACYFAVLPTLASVLSAIRSRSEIAGFLLSSLIPVLALTVISGPARAQCQTTVSGNVINDTWTLADSPVCVVGDLRVMGLTIEPGVQVWIDGDYRIDVVSSLWAAGTDADPIVFTSATGDWNGIHFQGTAPGSFMGNCVIEKADSGGLEIVNSLPSIHQCVIRDNTNTIGGGGVRIDIDHGNFALRECTISDNSSTTSGGGLYVHADNGSTIVLHGCTVSGNTANPTSAIGDYQGGGIHFVPAFGQLIITESDISGNRVNSSQSSDNSSTYSHSYGGGLYASGGMVTVVASRFCNNVAYAHAYAYPFWNYSHGYGYGGGVYFTGSGNALDVRNSTFACNTTPISSRNYSYSRGCGLYVENGTSNVTNCVFLKNGETMIRDTDALYNASGVVDVRGSIFWKNNQLTSNPDTYGGQVLGAGTTTIEYCDVMGDYPGTGNINTDPVFMDENCGSVDVHLVDPYSPCIDMGDSDSADDDACFPPGLGLARCDMGAYGGPSNCSPAMPAVATPRNTTNPNSLTASTLVIGRTFTAQVDLAGTTGHAGAVLVGYLSPLTLSTSIGDVLVNFADPGGELFQMDPAFGGGVVTFVAAIPDDPILCGICLYTQAAHVGGIQPLALSNAYDLIVGSF